MCGRAAPLCPQERTSTSASRRKCRDRANIHPLLVAAVEPVCLARLGKAAYSLFYTYSGSGDARIGQRRRGGSTEFVVAVIGADDGSLCDAFITQRTGSAAP
jgi:hypothetical protein